MKLKEILVWPVQRFKEKRYQELMQIHGQHYLAQPQFEAAPGQELHAFARSRFLEKLTDVVGST